MSFVIPPIWHELHLCHIMTMTYFMCIKENSCQYGCQKFCRDIKNPAPIFKVKLIIYFKCLFKNAENIRIPTLPPSSPALFGWRQWGILYSCLRVPKRCKWGDFADTCAEKVTLVLMVEHAILSSVRRQGVRTLISARGNFYLRFLNNTFCINHRIPHFGHSVGTLSVLTKGRGGTYQPFCLNSFIFKLQYLSL
jgi:hypothetical protein